ncbi:hydroxyacid dehydrogenase [Leptospira interrogans]
MRKVICIQPIHDDGMNILRARTDIELIVPESPEPQHWQHHLADAEAIAVRVTRIERWMIEKAPNLKIISRHGVGVDNIDLDAATERGVIVATVGEANAPSVVEHTLAMMFALAKRLPQFDHAIRNGNFNVKFGLDAMDIGGCTVLIVGLGRIGSRLATACNALGLRCLGIDPAFSPEEIRKIGCEPVASLHDALPLADFVTVHCPLQSDTRNLISARELALMKPSAYLINCARGGIIDEQALLAALDAGKIKGAALDVQVTEPPTPDDPLLKSDRIILTPHSAATTAACVARSSTNVALNIVNYFDGKLPPSHIFNPEALKR